MLIRYHPHFVRSYQKLSRDVQRRAEQREAMFRANPFDPRLDTHKLLGKLKRFWSFSVDKRNRILFEFSRNEIIFLDIGDHDIYR